MFEATKSFCDSLLEKGLPGFDLAVFADGNPVLRHWGGFSDVEKQIPINGGERYYIYSTSKPITCTAALQLWERGLFSLEDPLAKFMPEFACMTVKNEGGIRPARNPIRIRHLFEMSAGFSYELHSPQLELARQEIPACPTRQVMKYLAKEPLLFEPGERWNYSLCHDVLAALVEVISGQLFEDYVQSHIFAPIGMTSSTYMLPESERDTLAVLYRFSEGKAVPFGKNAYILGCDYASGGAGCVSTVDDYMKFLEGLRTYKLLKPETVKLFTTDRLTPRQRRTFTQGTYYGYGLGVRCHKEGSVRCDYGWGGAAGAYLAVDEAHGMTVFLAMHLLNSPVQGCRAMAYRFARAELFGTESVEDLLKELEHTHNYRLTY